MKNKILLVIAVMLMFFVVPTVYATVEDNFDRVDSNDCGTATNGNPWNCDNTTGEGIWNITDNMLKFTDTGSPSVNQYGYFNLTNTDPSRVDFEWNHTSLTGAAYVALYENPFTAGTKDTILCQKEPTTGVFRCHDGAGWVVSTFSFVANVRYNISFRNINYTADTFDIYVDDVLKKTGMAFRRNQGIDTFVNQVVDSEDYFIDNICTNEACPTESTTDTSLLASDFNISDFSLSSSTFTTVSSIEFNSSVDANFTVLSAFNAQKLTGALNNTISGRLLFDGSIILTEELVTVSGSDVKSTGFKPIFFEADNSNHTLELQFSRTGNGAVGISSMQFVLMKLESADGNRIVGKEFNVSLSHSPSSFVDVFNFSVDKLNTSKTFYYDKLSISNAVTTSSYRFSDVDDGLFSPLSVRSTDTTGDVGSFAMSWVEQNKSVGIHNRSIQAKNNPGVSRDLNGSLIYINLADLGNRTIASSFSTNISSNETANITGLGVGSHLLTSINHTIIKGGGLFISGIISVSSVAGASTDLVINSSDVNCSVMFMRDISSTGNVFGNFLCDGLVVGNSYVFDLWLDITSGSVDVVDESLSMFEVSLLDITSVNVPPIAGVFVDPNVSDINDRFRSGSVDVDWTVFTDPNGDVVSYDLFVINLTNTTKVCDNVSTSNCTFDSSVFSDGRYDLRITATDGLNSTSVTSAFPFSVFFSTNLILDNTPPDVIINSPIGQWSADGINFTCADNTTGGQLGIINSLVGVNDSRFSLVSQGQIVFGLPFANWFFFNFTDSSTVNISLAINCTDSAGNDNISFKNLSVDNIKPSCSPLSDQNLSFGESFDWNVSCVDDLNLYSLNVSCTGGTSYSFFEENINSTNFTFVNNTGVLNNSMNCSFITFDAHTLVDVRDVLNPFTVDRDNVSHSIKLYDVAIVTLDDSSIPLDSLSLDFSVVDRVRYTYDFGASAIKGLLRNYTFFVDGVFRVDYVSGLEYPAWFVVDRRYWVDFALSNDDGSTVYDVYRVNSSRYAVVITSQLGILEFESVGLLNQNLQSQMFVVSGSPSVFVVGSCPSNLTQSSLLWLMVGFGCFLLIIGWVARIALAGMLGSIVIMIMSWYVVGCESLMGWIFAFIGMFFLLWFALQFLGGKDDSLQGSL